jgi:hypothetical protein
LRRSPFQCQRQGFDQAGQDLHGCEIQQLPEPWFQLAGLAGYHLYLTKRLSGDGYQLGIRCFHDADGACGADVDAFLTACTVRLVYGSAPSV